MTSKSVEPRQHPGDVIRSACAAHGEDAVIDWCVALLTGEISAEAAFGADRPKLVAITGSPNPGGWSRPVDAVNYYWVRVWAARAFLYVWRDDVVAALLAAAKDPSWRVREHVARIAAQRELGQLVDALLPLLEHELPRVRAVGVRAIGAAGEFEHVKAVEDLRDDPDPTVRAAVERALERLKARLDRELSQRTHWASDLKLDYDDPTSRTVGSELVCSSITTGGDGADSASGTHPWLRWNPHLRFQNNLRGYVNTTITRESLEAEFRCVPKVQSKDAEVFTRASFTIEDRNPGLNQTYDNPPAPASARSLSIGDDAGVSASTVAWETARP